MAEGDLIYCHKGILTEQFSTYESRTGVVGSFSMMGSAEVILARDELPKPPLLPTNQIYLINYKKHYNKCVLSKLMFFLSIIVLIT